jgi:LAO/AO transport system kinase
MQSLIAWRKDHGHWDRTRAAQARHWFEAEVRDGLLAALTREPQKGLMTSLGDRVASGALTPEAAAAEMLTLLGRPP